MNLATTSAIVLALSFTFSNNLFANNSNVYREIYGNIGYKNSLPKSKIQENQLDIISIEKEFSANGRFYTQSLQQLSPQTGYYRLAVTGADGEKTVSNPFTVSTDFSRESFAFCCDEPDTETLSQSSFTVIDSMIESD